MPEIHIRIHALDLIVMKSYMKRSQWADCEYYGWIGTDNFTYEMIAESIYLKNQHSTMIKNDKKLRMTIDR